VGATKVIELLAEWRALRQTSRPRIHDHHVATLVLSHCFLCNLQLAHGGSVAKILDAPICGFQPNSVLLQIEVNRVEFEFLQQSRDKPKCTSGEPCRTRIPHLSYFHVELVSVFVISFSASLKQP
jgi:hypothetical protein